MSVVLESVALSDHSSPMEMQGTGPVILRLPEGRMSDEGFLALCRVNKPLHLEMDEHGDIAIMPPSDTEAGFNNADITTDLNNWNRKTKRGRVGDSNTGFRLANGAIRAPDASWVAKARWEAVPANQRKPFAHIAPDFVLELMSPSDRRSDAQAKMREYLENGVRLGWLIDPKKKEIEVYESGKDVVLLQEPQTVAGTPVLEGFVLDLTEIWEQQDERRP